MIAVGATCNALAAHTPTAGGAVDPSRPKAWKELVRRLGASVHGEGYSRSIGPAPRRAKFAIVRPDLGASLHAGHDRQVSVREVRLVLSVASEPVEHGKPQFILAVGGIRNDRELGQETAQPLPLDAASEMKAGLRQHGGADHQGHPTQSMKVSRRRRVQAVRRVTQRDERRSVDENHRRRWWSLRTIASRAAFRSRRSNPRGGASGGSGCTA